MNNQRRWFGAISTIVFCLALIIIFYIAYNPPQQTPARIMATPTNNVARDLIGNGMLYAPTLAPKEDTGIDIADTWTPDIYGVTINVAYTNLPDKIILADREWLGSALIKSNSLYIGGFRNYLRICWDGNIFTGNTYPLSKCQSEPANHLETPNITCETDDGNFVLSWTGERTLAVEFEFDCENFKIHGLWTIEFPRGTVFPNGAAG